MKVDRRWRGASRVHIGVVTAGLVLLGAACAFLGWGSRARQRVANGAAVPSAVRVFSADAAAAGIPFEVGQIADHGVIAPGPASPRSANESVEAKSRAQSLFAGLPLMFEPNLGQANLDPADPGAKFVARGSGYRLLLGSGGALLSLVSRDSHPHISAGHPSTRLDVQRDMADSTVRVETLLMKLAGANPDASLTATDPLPGKSNYLIGSDPAKWRRGVPQFARVRYENIYPGINLVFYGNQGRLEYDFQVAPGSDPSQAELEFQGAARLELKDGSLVIHGQNGSVQLEAPRVYQEIAGHQQPVEGSFVLRGDNRAGFAIGSYDHSRELIIDPILTFSSYFGGSGDELATYVAVDSAFNIYLTGSTTSTNLPIPVSLVYQTTLKGAQNIYIAKIQPPLGSIPAALEFVTYLGGSGTDSPVGIQVDGSFDPYVVGTTSSPNFPTTSTSYQTKPYAGSTGTAHVFVTELKNNFDQLAYSSYLSGNGTDVASGMTIDASGDIYVTGTTTSNNVANAGAGIQFPASTAPQGQAFQIRSNAAIQFFVTEVDTLAPSSSGILYSTYFGGANYSPPLIAVGGGIAVDVNKNIYFTGTTNFTYTGCSGCSSTDFPILNAFQPCLDQPAPTVIVNPPTCSYTTTPTAPDAFAARLNPNPNPGQGGELVWSTYIGGSATDSGAGIGVDVGAANVYVVGTTNSTDIGENLTTLSTSAPYERCLDLAPFNTSTNICNMPAGTPPYPSDAFVARITNTTPSSTTPTPNVALNYFSYLGGTGNDSGLAIAVDSASGALVTGWTQSTDFPVFPTANPIQSALAGTQDAFVARLNTAATTGQTTAGSWANYFGGSTTSTGASAVTTGTGIALDVNQATYLAGNTNSVNLQVNKPFQATNAGGNDAFVTEFGPVVNLSLTGVLTLGTNQTFISAGNQATFTYTLTNNGPDLATGITVTDNLSPTVTQVPLSFNSASSSSGTCNTVTSANSVSCFIPSLQAGSTVTLTIVVTPTASTTPSGPTTFNGGTVQATGPGNIVLAQTSVPAQMSDFKMTVSPNNASVPAAGDTAVYQVYLTPLPVYSSSISLSCSGLPVASNCNFTNSPATLVGGPASSQLNLTTTVRPIVTGMNLQMKRLYAIWLTLPGLVLVCVGAVSRKRRRIIGMFLLWIVFAMLLLLPACSGTVVQPPVSGTPAGTYTITVTAISGTDTRNQSITLVVP